MSSSSSSIDTASISASTSSLWDRITTWASENKATVYTIAGTVVVVTGAGAVYYFYGSRKSISESSEKRKSKKERRKEKKEAEAEKQDGISLRDEEAGEQDRMC